jgi:DNA polymerase-3 subunit delta'
VSLSEIRYQTAAVRMLRSAMAGDRVAHAYIFAGPRGVGKGLAARQFAKLLMCAKPRGSGEKLDPCDKCGHCTRIDRDTHPDLYWFRKEEDRNDFRLSIVTRRQGESSASPSVTVTESVVLHPMEAARTVTVLDDAELLNASAANALLKTLEEPSPHAVLILLCADASELPGTILSRCQWVRFNPLPEEFVEEKVREVLAAQAAKPPEKGRKAEAPRPIAREEIAFICRFAGVSIEQAVQLAGSGLWGLKRAILPGLEAMDEADALDKAEAIAGWAVTEARRRRVPKGTPEETAVRRSSARLALAVVASVFRDAAMVAVGASEAARLTNADQPDVIQALAAWSVESCGRAVSVLADAQAQIVRYVHVELATENALVQVSRLRPAVASRR